MGHQVGKRTAGDRGKETKSCCVTEVCQSASSVQLLGGLFTVAFAVTVTGLVLADHFLYLLDNFFIFVFIH